MTGTLSSGPAIARAMDIAKTYAGEKVVKHDVGRRQSEVMLEVRFSEMDRTAAKQIGFNTAFINNSGKFQGGIGNTAPTTTLPDPPEGVPTINLWILDSFGRHRDPPSRSAA